MPKRVLKVHQQVDDLRLHRNIERRHRLVADDEQRLESERPRDDDALSLAPGEFVRKAISRVARQSDHDEAVR